MGEKKATRGSRKGMRTAVISTAQAAERVTVTRMPCRTRPGFFAPTFWPTKEMTALDRL